MKIFKLLFAAALVLSLGVFTSCDPDGKASNKLVIMGTEYEVIDAHYMKAESDSPNGTPYHFDLHTKGDQITGYGEVVYPGKDVNLSEANCPVYMGFNFMDGGYYGPEFKSGTLKLTDAGNGDIIINIDAVDQNNERFVLSAVFQGELAVEK